MPLWLRYITIGALLLLYISCKKQDTTPPEITVSAPYENSTFHAFDQATITGNASDNEKVHSIKVTLKSSSGKVLLESVTQITDMKEGPFSINFTFDDIYLPTGNYYFKITASDLEGNTSSEFVDIHFIEHPRRLRGVYYMYEDALNTTAFLLDSAGNTSTLFQYSGDYLGGYVNHYDQVLVVTGDTTGNAHLVEFDSKAHVEIKENSSFPAPKFTDIKPFERKVYLATYHGRIAAYDGSGVSSNAFQVDNGYYPKTIDINETYVLVAEKSISSGNVNLTSYYRTSGGKVGSVPFSSYDVQSIYLDDGNLGYVFVQNSNNIEIHKCNVEGGSSTLVKKIYNTTFKAISTGEGNICFILTDAGIYKFNTSSASTQLLASGLFLSIAYDDLKQRIYVGTQSAIELRDSGTGNLIQSWNIGQPVDGIALRYNK